MARQQQRPRLIAAKQEPSCEKLLAGGLLQGCGFQPQDVRALAFTFDELRRGLEDPSKCAQLAKLAEEPYTPWDICVDID